jgi:VanZ family protein
MSRIPFPLAPRWLRWTGVAVVTGIIICFSILKTTPTPPELGPIWDKKLHFAAYAGLAYTLAYATVDWQHRQPRRVGGVLATAVLFGLTIELIQGTLPMRYYGVGDLVANCIGASLVVPGFLVESRVEYVELRELRHVPSL